QRHKLRRLYRLGELRLWGRRHYQPGHGLWRIDRHRRYEIHARLDRLDLRLEFRRRWRGWLRRLHGSRRLHHRRWWWRRFGRGNVGHLNNVGKLQRWRQDRQIFERRSEYRLNAVGRVWKIRTNRLWPGINQALTAWIGGYH